MQIIKDHYSNSQSTRLDEIRKLLDLILSNIPNPTIKTSGFTHLYGTGQAAVLLSSKRGLTREEAELACVAGSLHDLLKYISYNEAEQDHAHKCAEYAKEMILDRIPSFSEEEKEKIYNAIAHHDNKEGIDTPFDEILKDADALQRYLRNPMDDCFYYKSRVQAVLKEFKD